MNAATDRLVLCMRCGERQPTPAPTWRGLCGPQRTGTVMGTPSFG